MIPQENWKYLPARELPKIELAGVQFYVDMRLWECREVDDFMNKFSLDDLDERPGGLICCFDSKTRNLFHGTRETYEARKHELTIVKLPSIKIIDPVGWRALLGLPQKKENGLLEKTRVRKSKGKRI